MTIVSEKSEAFRQTVKTKRKRCFIEVSILTDGMCSIAYAVNRCFAFLCYQFILIPVQVIFFSCYAERIASEEICSIPVSSLILLCSSAWEVVSVILFSKSSYCFFLSSNKKADRLLFLSALISCYSVVVRVQTIPQRENPHFTSTIRLSKKRRLKRRKPRFYRGFPGQYLFYCLLMVGVTRLELAAPRPPV